MVTSIMPTLKVGFFFIKDVTLRPAVGFSTVGGKVMTRRSAKRSIVLLTESKRMLVIAEISELSIC